MSCYGADSPFHAHAAYLYRKENKEDVLKMMEVSPAQAYFMGCVACRFGKSIESNPFEEFSDTWKKYREGWSHAEEHPYPFQSSENLYA